MVDFTKMTDEEIEEYENRREDFINELESRLENDVYEALLDEFDYDELYAMTDEVLDRTLGRIEEQVERDRKEQEEEMECMMHEWCMGRL